MSVTTAADGIKEIRTPLSDADIESLKAGDRVRKTTARGSAKRATPTAKRTASRKVSPIPKGYHTVTAYLTVSEGPRRSTCTAAPSAPGSRRRCRHRAASWRTRSSRWVTLSGELPQPGGTKAPTSLGGASDSLFVYVSNVAASFKRASTPAAGGPCRLRTCSGATGSAALVDPFGHHWGLATHKERRVPGQDEKARRGRDGADGATVVRDVTIECHAHRHKDVTL